MNSSEDGLCCEACSCHLDALIVLPSNTSSCPTCSSTKLTKAYPVWERMKRSQAIMISTNSDGAIPCCSCGTLPIQTPYGLRVLVACGNALCKDMVSNESIGDGLKQAVENWNRMQELHSSPKPSANSVFASAAHLMGSQIHESAHLEEYSEVRGYQPSSSPPTYRLTKKSVYDANSGWRLVSAIPDEGLDPLQVASLDAPILNRIGLLVCACGLGRPELEKFARRCAARTLSLESSPIIRICLETGNPAHRPEALAAVDDIWPIEVASPWKRNGFKAQSLAIRISGEDYSHGHPNPRSLCAEVMMVVKLVILHFRQVKWESIEVCLLDDLLQIMGAG